jgi:hypothetical protein
MRYLTAGFLYLFSCSHALAGELLESYVHFDDDHYLLHLDMRVEAESAKVYATLVDFNNMKSVNDTIVGSKLLESNGRVHRVQFESEGCVWIFCRSVNQVVTVTELGGGYIMSQTDPDESDLTYGKTLWQVINEGDFTRVKYDADYVPAFWIPPLIGPYIFQERMLEEGLKTLNGIELLARDRR